jgi:hypothetical protein
MYRGQPLVKKGGTMIITHPCTDRFDHDQHAPYVEFVHRLLPETRDAMELHKKYEAEFAAQPGVPRDVPQGQRVPPRAPLLHVVLGRGGRQHIGRVIVVGADNEYIPHPRLRDRAVDARGAGDGEGHRAVVPEITCMHLPPIVMADMKVRAGGVK